MSLESPDMCLVKECLEGVGLYEESMGQDEMLRYYNVIKSSESTATEEKKRRQHNNNSEEVENLVSGMDFVEVPPECSIQKNVKKTFTPKSWSTIKRHLNINTSSTSNTNNNKECLSLDELKNNLNAIDIYQYNIKGQKNLEVTQVPNHYGPYYCHKSLDNLSIHEKVKRILFHHSALAQMYYKQQRSSIKLAELGNPICQSLRFDGDIEKNNLKTDSDEKDDFEFSGATEVYTSRGGRATKRKVYAEEYFSEEDSETDKKKSKQETLKVKKPNIKKLTNEEIMNRSSLFNDSLKTPRNRAEKMFDKLQNDESKRKKAELEREKFDASLDTFSDDFDIKITSSQNLTPSVSAPEAAVSEEVESTTITKLRVVHPLTGRRGYKRSQMLLPVTETITKPISDISSSPLNKTLAVEEVIEVKKNTPNKGPKKKQACPICNQSFFQKDIENHASTCGLTSELEIENNLPTHDNNMITCEICDKVFILNTAYEVHVKDCIERQRNT